MFSKLLHRKLRRGQCQDDVLIVYSVEHNDVFTVVGAGSKRKIDSRLVSEIEQFARKCFCGLTR